MLDQIQSEVIFHEVIDSTNVEAKRLIENNKINKATWIIANRQTSGKGRNLSLIHISEPTRPC